jgi:hypothetical protein
VPGGRSFTGLHPPHFRSIQPFNKQYAEVSSAFVVPSPYLSKQAQGEKEYEKVCKIV